MGNTVNAEFALSGVGLHLGAVTTVQVVPATAAQGRYFVRTDLPGHPTIPADLRAVAGATLSTELGVGNVKVRTVEHLLAALMACNIDDARIEIDGAEVPLLDGSAQNWCEAIAQVGLAENQGQNSAPIVVTEPVWIREQDSFVAALPATTPRLTYGIDFPYQAIGNQWYSWDPQESDFATDVAPARTFGFAEQIEQLQQAGLIKGGSLENALVCSHQGWLNPPLRFTNEPARHKLLDLVGDLSLLGFLPQAHIIAYKASHKLHLELAEKLAKLYGRESAMSGES